MSVPNSPGSVDLARSMNIIGKNIKTSKFRFYNWNVKMGKYDTKLPDKAFKDLARAAKFYREGFYSPQQIKEMQTNAKKAVDNAKKVADDLKNANKEVGKVKKVVNDTKKVIDKFLEKIPGKDSAKKAVKGGAMLANVAVLAGIVAVLAAKIITDIQIQNMGFSNDEVTRSEIQKAFDRYQRNVIDIRGLGKRTKDLELENQRVRDRVYSIEKQQPQIRENANNALYETRQGRKIVEGKIATTDKKANDALYETRQGRAKLEATITAIQNSTNQTISKITQSLQQQVQSFTATIRTLETGLSKANNEVTKANTKINELNTANNRVNRVIADIPKAINAVNNAANQTITKVVEQLNKAVAQPQKKWGVTVTPVQVTPATVTFADSTGVTVTPATVTPAQVTYSDFSTSEYGDYVKEMQRRETEQLERKIIALGGGVTVSASKAEEARLTALEALKKSSASPFVDLTPIEKEIAKVKADVAKKQEEELKKYGDRIDQQSLNIGQVKTDIKGLETKIKEQEKVNEEAVKKLDKMFPLLNGISLIPGRVADAIRPDIPTIPEIEKAAATGVCRSTQSGGCMNKALNDQSNSINNNTNNAANNILQGLDTAGTGALLTGQQEILNRLGSQIPGGISGKLVNGFKWLKLDRALSILTFAATIQNHLMLSNDIGQTLLGAFSNVLTLIGLKDDNEQPYDIGSIINSTIENLVKGIVGVENYTVISAAWAKANRIYQATTNVLNAFQSLSSAILTGLEMTAGKVGKIGNALKKVPEKYRRMLMAG